MLTPHNLPAMLAKLKQEQQAQRQALMAKLSPHSRFGYGLGTAVGELFGANKPENSTAYKAAAEENERLAAAKQGLDMTSPESLMARGKELLQSGNYHDQFLGEEMIQRSMALSKMLTEQKVLENQARSTGVQATLGEETLEANIAKARNQAIESGFKAEIAEQDLDYLNMSFSDRLRQEYLNAEKLQQQLANLGIEEDLLFRQLEQPMRLTNFGTLIQEQDKLIEARAALDPEKQKAAYDVLTARIKDYQNKIMTDTLGLERSIDGTELTKGNATRIQQRLLGWESLTRGLTKLRDLIQNPGNSVGEIPQIRENLSGRLGSAFSEIFGEQVGRAVSEAIASDDTVKVRTAAELVVTQFTQQIHQYGGRYTRTAEEAAQRIMHTLETTTDERAALDAILTVMDYVEESYQMDLTALLNAQIGAEDALEVSMDPVMQDLLDPDKWEK